MNVLPQVKVPLEAKFCPSLLKSLTCQVDLRLSYESSQVGKYF